LVITVASGKGGTGKTAVAVSMALAASRRGNDRVLLLDSDVEEPNAGLFLDVDYDFRRETGVLIPSVAEEKCTFCGRCSDVCAWNAVAVAGSKILVFDDLCHGCGSCSLSCPQGAIEEMLHATGVLEGGRAGDLEFARGTLDVGKAMPVPVISALLEEYLTADFQGTAIIDSSPGTSCPVVETVSRADYVVLVTEPTPFGLHDLQAAVDVVSGQLNKKAGVVVNRDGIGDDAVDRFCRAQGIPVIARLREDRAVAQALSEGIPIIDGVPAYAGVFHEILEAAESEGMS